MSLRLSVLDVSPVPSGSSSRDALLNTLDLARLADGLGYTRYWLAEHHNSAGIASSVPEVMIGQVANVTTRIRVGSGGVMLPNHASLKVVETFRVLEALYPGRIDLGIGRAPGTDAVTAFALRRSREALTADDFPEQLSEVLAFFSGGFPAGHPFQRITPVPDGVATPELWLLGSSDFSAQVAAAHGLGFAFAHHINPELAVETLRAYRAQFRPSALFAEPRALLAASVVCGETEAQAEELARSVNLAWLRLAKGERGLLPSVAEALAYPYTPADRERMRAGRDRHFAGSPSTVRARLTSLAAEAGVEEVMVLTMVHDHEARRRSYSLLASAFALSPG